MNKVVSEVKQKRKQMDIWSERSDYVSGAIKLLDDYLIVYFGLLFSAGYFFCELYSRYTALGYLLFLVSISIYRKRKINLKSIYYFGIILFGVLISWITSGIPESKVMILFLVRILCCILICNIVSTIEFKRIYNRLMEIIAIFSIFGYVLVEYNSSVYMIFPELINSKGRVGYFLVFTTISDFSHTGANRIQGIFWEPGVFQVFLIVAMIITYFEKKSRKRIVKELLYSVALVLTYSTTGIFALIVFWIFVFVRRFQEPKLIILIILGTGALLIYFICRNQVSGFLYYTLYQKMDQVFNSIMGVGKDTSSRVDSVIYPLKLCVNNPLYLIFGYGQRGLEEMTLMAGHSSFTCTPIIYLLERGLIVAGTTIISFSRLIASLKLKIVDALILVILILLCVSSENMSFNIILSVMLYYGYSKSCEIDVRYDEEYVRYEDCYN